MRRGDGKGEGSGGGGGGGPVAAAWGAAREAGMVVVARVVRAAAVETVVTRAVEVRQDGWRRGRRQADTGLEGAACVPGDASAKCARSKDVATEMTCG